MMNWVLGIYLGKSYVTFLVKSSKIVFNTTLHRSILEPAIGTYRLTLGTIGLENYNSIEMLHSFLFGSITWLEGLLFG